MKLYLVRHGETIENLKKIVMGQRHGILSKLGKKQAKQIARSLKNHKFEAVYSSDLKRAADTAREITKFHPHLTAIYTKSLREASFGKLEGKPRKQAEIFFAKLPGTFMSKRAISGEAPKDLRKRVKSFINHLLKNHKNDAVLIITHSGVIKMFLSIFKKISPQKIWETIKIGNVGGYCITIREKNIKVTKLKDSPSLPPN